jgi:uroporphyrinogen-III synthase
MRPTILLTRPEPAASSMAEDLRAALPGAAVLVSPLMRIAYGGALPPLAGSEALIFTSRHGVEGFCRLSPCRDLRAYSVGEATAEAARARGLRTVAAGGDAEALLARIAEAGDAGPFLHPRGRHVAADIAGALRARGHVAAETVVYTQEALPLSPEARALLAGAAPVLLPVMSPRSGRLFFAEAGEIRAPLLVAAISRNAAQSVPEGAASRLIVAQSPDASAMQAALGDLMRDAKRVEGRGGAQ